MGMSGSRTVDVWWLSMNDGTPERGYWDQAILEGLFAGSMWGTGVEFAHHVGVGSKPAGGAVVVIPARSHANHVAGLQSALATMPWVLLVVAGDEERVFPWRDLTHPRMRVWVQTPNLTTDAGADGYLPVGWTPMAAEAAADQMFKPDRVYQWAFMGQVTHERREACVAELRSMYNGVLVESASFTAGVPQDGYLRVLENTVVAPCPSGPVTVDTFRMCEALELGAIPILDAFTPRADQFAYWPMIFAEATPCPVVDTWTDVPFWIGKINADRERWQVTVRSWWTRTKRDIATRFALQARDLAGIPDLPDDRVTVIVSCSPILSHPDTAIIDETIRSIRWHLPYATIILACDGVRPEQEHLRGRYEQWLWDETAAPRPNVIVDYDGSWRHQAGTTKRAMRLVATGAILFVEHDTPLLDQPIPFGEIIDAVSHGDADVIRFAHEAQIHPEHRWLMIDLEPRDLRGVPVQQTMQWSQRPHVADAGWYRRVLAAYFGAASRTMIEDTLHGVLQVAWDVHGQKAGETWRVFVFTPPGVIKRSTHTDGRGTEPKYDMRYEYDGETPAGAPYPTSGRDE